MPADRLFVAIPLPAPVREQLAALYETSGSIAWTRPEQLHLTLRFLGEVGPEWTDSFGDALELVQVEPFVLPVTGLGVFPPRGQARVIWIGVGHGHPRLYQLRQQIDDALLGTGFPLDVRIFHPHVTLGRLPPSGPATAAAEFLKRHRDFEASPIRVDTFRLYQSDLRPGGAVHTLRREFDLRLRSSSS